jgi:subtilisin family serine protease
VTSNVYGKLLELNQLGVIIVASAGNDASAAPVYPAAFSTDQNLRWPGKGNLPGVLAVGALMRPATNAIFSNEAPWVNVWCSGSAIVSTLPRALAGGQQPARRSAAVANSPIPRIREAYDPDNFDYGFGVWSGTSFAAAICTATVAQYLLAGPAKASMDQVTSDAARTRARQAVKKILSDQKKLRRRQGREDREGP